MEQTECYEEIVIHLSELHKKMKQIQAQMLAEYHISLMEYHILSFMMKAKAASQNDLALALDVDKALISRQIQALEKRGLLYASPDPDCRRKKILTLSAFALDILPRLEEVHKRSLARIFKDMDPQEIQGFNYFLEGLVKSL